MYKNRVKNDRKCFEIPALLSCKRGNLAENGSGKFKIYIILNLPTLDFHIRKIKEQEFQKNFCRSLPYSYTFPGLTKAIYKNIMFGFNYYFRYIYFF